ncbi:MAG: transposase [Melioribacteraceae bacterium]|nr:transposase [Melioribacteraceae bacterium]
MREQIKEKPNLITDERSSSVMPLRVYSESFKLKVVREVLSGNFTSKESARQHFGIRSKSAILDWMRLYSGAEGIDKAGRLMKDRDNMSEEIAKQSMRIKELEAALRKEELKVDLSNAFIDIAKEKYGIDLRKKCGAKQFNELKRNEKKK